MQIESLRIIFLFLTTLIQSIMAYGESRDSICTSLDEVVVEGMTQRVIQYGVEYIPGKKVKRASHDAFTLLFHMHAPQLEVSPFDWSVTTQNGGMVAAFIDYVPATTQELQGLRPEDVLRVEVLEYPPDPRFGSAPHVVNFIMRRYEWGGYTKLTVYGQTLNDEHLDGKLYQKFVYGDWTFDASASGAGSWERKYRDHSSETFRNFDFDGRLYDKVTRVSSTTGFKGKRNREDLSLRGIYEHGNKFLSHTISFLRTARPEITKYSTVTFSDDIFPDSEAKTESTGQSISVATGGDYRFTLPSGQYLETEWSFGHSSNRENSIYSLGNLADIGNRQREKTYAPSLTLTYSKNLGHDNTLSTMLSSYATIYDTDYYGSYNGIQKLVSSESMLFLDYMQSWGLGLNLFSRVGASYVLGRVNGENRIHNWSPRLGLVLQYRLHSRSALGLEAWWANSHPEAATSNNALVQSTELMWMEGNPDLRNIYGPTVTARYSWIPTNRFSLSATVNYEDYTHAPVYIYLPVVGLDGIVRKFSDDNTERLFSGSLSGTLRLVDNSLLLTASGVIKRSTLSGVYPLGLTCVTVRGGVSYYRGNLSLSVYYLSPSKDILNKSGYLTKTPAGYLFMATYSLGNFRASLNLRHLFSDGRVRSSYDSSYYSTDSWKWTNGTYKNIDLTLSYTFSYGKRVDRSENLKNRASRQSAILE